MRADDARERRRHRFLADAEMHGTAHLVRRMIFRHEHLFDAANEVHHPVELKARWRSTAHDSKGSPARDHAKAHVHPREWGAQVHRRTTFGPLRIEAWAQNQIVERAATLAKAFR